jgi:uncharacterized heparinase superfamily protein
MAVVAAVLVATGSLWLAAQPAHDACATRHHDCNQTARISQCCCGDQGVVSDQGGPVEARVRVSADASSVPVAFTAGTIRNAFHTGVPVHTSPPGRSPADLRTLFASLLI